MRELRATVADARMVAVGVAVGLRRAVKAVRRWRVPLKDHHLQGARNVHGLARFAHQRSTQVVTSFALANAA